MLGNDRLTILMIDDEAYRTRLYRQYLEEAGYGVEFASTLDEALDLLQDPDFRPVLLIQDMQMGRPGVGSQLSVTDSELNRFFGMSGMWFIIIQREWLVGRKIPVLILTQRNPAEFQETVDLELRSRGLTVMICHKLETRAVQLPAIVKTMIDDGRV